MKKILLAAGFVMAATTAALAQGYVYGAPYGGGIYNYSPGYESGPGYGSGLYDYAPGYGYGGWYDYDRVDAPGRGNSAESQR
ncbi:MAG TPA: hypothetical protein VL048_03015 [Xanthobacteraceae bacterium]|jgi:hypothetical protein|nr:hypothetical protein [Xanthobacteraceae bacterium]